MFICPKIGYIKEEKMNNKLYVGNLDYSVQSNELKEVFGSLEVTDCIVIEGKGFGFVTFADANAANTAKEEFHNKEFKGRSLKIDFAQERSSSDRKGFNKDGFSKKRY